MTSATYDLIATGQLDTNLTGNPQMTFWRSTYKSHTRFALESVSQPFSTTVNFGAESQIVVNRMGDLIYNNYLHVTIPGIVAKDLSSSEHSYNGILAGNQFPQATDVNGVCNPCASNDEAALLKYLPDNYNDLSGADQDDALKVAKNRWRNVTYGGGPELGCCASADDCVDQSCPELGDTFCYWVNDIGHVMIKQAKLISGGQTSDQMRATFLIA